MLAVRVKGEIMNKIKFSDKVNFLYEKYMQKNRRYKLLFRFFLFIKYLKFYSAHHKYNLKDVTTENQRIVYLALCKFFGTIKVFSTSKNNKKHLLSVLQKPFLRKLSYLFFSLGIKSFLKKEFNYELKEN